MRPLQSSLPTAETPAHFIYYATVVVAWKRVGGGGGGGGYGGGDVRLKIGFQY